MTYSLIVREPCHTEDGSVMRFGIGVTTNNPGVGVFCPSVSENGVVAAQYQTYGEIGPAILSALDDGIPATDAVPAALDASDRAPMLQVHAISREHRAVHHGEELPSDHEAEGLVFGDVCNENYSVAGNSLVNVATLEAAAESFEEASRERPLADRLIEALVAGDAAGGDGRETDARSGAIRVVDPTAGIANEWYNDLRVDASPTPLADLRAQYNRAKSYHDEASAEWS